MKRGMIAVLACAALVACVVAAGCSSGASSASSSSASSSAASSGTSSSSSSSASGASGAWTGMPDPWTDAATAAEAGEAAGVGAFTVPEGEIADLGTPFSITYSSMEGIAQAYYEIGACGITARKGAPSQGEDISGDYDVYAHEWTQDVDGTIVNCAGNREGEATRAYWTHDGYRYSVTAQGLGGDTDFGLTAERLAAFVKVMNG